MSDLRGKVAVVTGTAHGIGTAIAAALRADGATVHGVDKDQADLADPAAVRAFFAAVGGGDTFSGGITAGRGHEGDNAGEEAIVDAVLHHRQRIRRYPVFGCSLF